MNRGRRAGGIVGAAGRKAMVPPSRSTRTKKGPRGAYLPVNDPEGVGRASDAMYAFDEESDEEDDEDDLGTMH